MDWLIYGLLGLVQGITEWLPISSSGHLVMIEDFFHVSSPGLTFEVLLNFATFLAMIIVFRKELWELILGFFRYIFKESKSDKVHFHFGLYIIIGTIPAGVLGVLFGDYIEEYLKSLNTVAIALIITGLGLYVISKIDGNRDKLTVQDSIWIGLFQAVALIPGISRSGATIVASLYRKLNKDLAIRYSFFLAIPVSLGTMILKIKELTALNGAMLLNYSFAFIVALVSAIFAIKWFIGILNRGNIIYFTYYCIVVGAGVLVIHNLF